METNRIEYKRELTPDLDIEKEVIAFLNYKEGGYIYIGIDDDGTIIGVEDADECMLKLKDVSKTTYRLRLWGCSTLRQNQEKAILS